MTSSLSMINGIVSLVNMSTQGIQGTATAAATAIQTVEKASVILTIISAAFQIATSIANALNNDDEAEARIEGLQRMIDELQWELDNKEAVLFSKNIDIFKEIQIATQDATDAIREMANEYLAINPIVAAIVAQQEYYRISSERLAEALAKVTYTESNILGEKKYERSLEDMENYAHQIILLQEQLEEERGKKDPDYESIDEIKRQIEETGNEAVSSINEMVEDIIGSSAEDIAQQLGDAFFDAFKEGEDAAKAWGDTVQDIVADIVKRMLVTKILEEPLGDIFDKYKEIWFPGGIYQGSESIIDSMGDFQNELNDLITNFTEAMDGLPSEVKDIIIGEAESSRQSVEKGIASASQDSVDELNARATTIQSHTYTIAENTKILTNTVNYILQSVINIDGNTYGLTARMENVEKDVREMRNTVNDLAIKGIKIKS